MLWEMFRQQGSKFCRDYQNRVPVQSWDNKKKGYLTYNKIHQIAQRVALFGPLAGIMGRNLEHELQLNPMLVVISTSLMERAMKENNVLKDSDIEKDSWSYWDTHQSVEPVTFNEPPEPRQESASSTQAPALVLIPGPRYTDHRERGRSRGQSSCPPSTNSSGSRW